MWPDAQVGHGPEVATFAGLGAFQANFEKTFIEPGNGQFGRGFHHSQSNRTGRGKVPGVLALFLQKIGITLGFFHDGQSRFIGVTHTELLSRFAQGIQCCHCVELVDLWVFKQAF